jgi:hypothetical protein
MSRVLACALAILAGMGTSLWANYRWHQGFAAGADTTLCLISHKVDGVEAAMQTRACRNIANREAPFSPWRPA